MNNLEIPRLRYFIGKEQYSRVLSFANTLQQEGGRRGESSPLTREERDDVLTLPGMTSKRRYTTPDPRKYIGTYNPDSISYSTYEKMSEDYQIYAGLCIIKLPIGQISWDIECKDEEVRAFVKQEISRLLRNLIRNMLTAVEYGFAPHEKVWEVIPSYILYDDRGGSTTRKDMAIIKKIKLVRPETIIINRDEYQNYSGLTQEGVGTIQADKSLLFSHDVQYGNLYGRPRIRGSYQPWYWSHLIIAFCNRFHERFGQPLALGRAPVGDSQVGVDSSGKPIRKSNIDLMQEVLESIQEHTSVTIPSSTKEEAGYDISFLTSESKGQQFLEYLRLLDAWKLRGMFIPETVLTQPYESGGSYGLARTHTSTFMKGEEDLVISIVDCINQQLIPQLVQYNYGKKAPSARMVFNAFSDELRGFLQKIYNNMILKGTAVASANELANELGIPVEMKEAVVPQDIPVPSLPEEKKRVPEVEGEGVYNGKKLRDFELVVNLSEIDNWADEAKEEFLKITKSFRKKYVSRILQDLQEVYTREPEVLKKFFSEYKTPYLSEYQSSLEQVLKDLFEKGRESVSSELENKKVLKEEPPEELIEDTEIAHKELKVAASIIAMLDNDILNRKLFWDTWQYRLKQISFLTIIAVLRERILKEINQSLILMIGYAIQQALTFGRTFQASVLEDLIEKVYYTSVLDKNTCNHCKGLDGQEFIVDSQEYYENMPPHKYCEGGSRCRCLYIYV